MAVTYRGVTRARRQPFGRHPEVRRLVPQRASGLVMAGNAPWGIGLVIVDPADC
jgi:hypothetical protein